MQGRGGVAGSRSRFLWSGGCRAKATKEERGLQVLEWVHWVSGERAAVVQFGAVRPVRYCRSRGDRGREEVSTCLSLRFRRGTTARLPVSLDVLEGRCLGADFLDQSHRA